MSTQATDQAALAWADRMEKGEAPYDPYLVALARLSREQKAQIDRLVHLLGITPEDAPSMEDAGRALSEAKAKTSQLEGMLRTITRWETRVWPDDFISLDGEQYRILKDATAKEIARDLARGRMLLEGEDGSS